MSVRFVAGGLVAGVALALLPVGVVSADPRSRLPAPQEIVPGIVIKKAPPEPPLQPPPKRKNLVQIPTSTQLTMVQANIFRGLGPAQFTADFREVLAQQPDFITLNEAVRPPALLTVPGYAFHRGTNGRWAMETTVMWRTDVWQQESTGTRFLVNRPGKWGTRAVNWVRLKHLPTGRTATLISVHPSPTIPSTEGLLQIYMGRLSALVRELSVYGPVFAGGDLNAHHTSQRYPRPALTAAGLVATFDKFGKPPGGTGDHGGATIDYLLYQPSAGVTAEAQWKLELNSDHDAVVGRFTWSW